MNLITFTVGAFLFTYGILSGRGWAIGLAVVLIIASILDSKAVTVNYNSGVDFPRIAYIFNRDESMEALSHGH